MHIKDKINKQVSAGFSFTEIHANLLADGHSREEIDHELRNIPVDAPAPGNNVSPWRKVWIVVLVLIAVIRLIRVFTR